MIKVAAYQYTPAIDIRERKAQIQNILEKAASKEIDFLCLPEGSLTGYFAQEELARKNSLEVAGGDFQEWLEVFRNSTSTIIVGFNERDGDHNFDSAGGCCTTSRGEPLAKASRVARPRSLATRLGLVSGRKFGGS